MIIAIDGPGAAGKSTIAKLLARSLGYVYIDTGAMYRAVALAVLRRGIDIGDAGAVTAALADIEIGLAHDAETGEQRITLGGEDVTGLLRAPRISVGASDVSRIPAVRLRMAELQRKIAKSRDVVMDGRDIGTFVFPDADKKFYLTSSATERARRRYLELRAGGVCATYEKCLADLTYRDENDSARSFAPLAVARDAVYIETDSSTTAREVAGFLRSEVDGYGEKG